jgi:aspartate 1-decarboxylase
LILNLLKCKIHRATVTEANLHYVGSITIDEDLMDAAGLLEYEGVHVLDITNGNRLEIYVIKGTRGSGCICINGADAHLINKNDLVIIVAYCQLGDIKIDKHIPAVVHVKGKNKIVSLATSELSLN